MVDKPPHKRRKIAGERRRQPTQEAAGDARPPAEPKPPRASSPLARGGSAGGEIQPGGGGGAATWLLVGLSVLLAAAVIFDLVVGIRAHTESEQRTSSTAAITSALRQAPTQAETAAVRMLAYDYQSLQEDADEAKSLMTPTYAATFQKTVDDLLKAPANKVRAHVEADVKASGVVNADAGQVEVMLFVDQTSRTTAQPEPQTYLNRVVFTMVKEGDRWLVDDVTAL